MFPNQSSSTDPNAAASTAPTDSGATASAAPEASPAPTDTASNDLFGGAITAGDGGSAPAEEKPKKASLAHIKSKPFKKGGQLLNTVYIAREGDTLDSVSERLFGENKVKELKKANPSLKVNLKPGDKVYFNSPNRPDDNEKMMTVYEDQGLPPTAYTTKEGDTLKSLSMEWYGTESGYKEIYALNKNVNSTTELAPGTELQYWPSSVSVMAYAKKPEGGSDVAQNPPVQEEPAPSAPPPVAEVIPPPPPTGPAPDMMGQNNMGAMPGAGSMNNSLPPPPPPPDLNAPAFPPPPTMAKKKPAATEVMDKDTIMYAVAAGVLLIGGGALVAIRRRSNKRNQGITQV
jgi:phage tail protein X